MKITSALLIILITVSSAHAAGIHKCKDASGNISYSQTPCPDSGSQMNIENRRTDDLTRQMDAAEAAERSRQYTDSQQRAADTLKGPAKSPRTSGPAMQPAKISGGDRMRLEEIERSIRIRSESRIGQNQDEISALLAEKRAIYAKYGIDIRPRRASDAEWEIMELEREIRALKREARD